MPALPQPLRDLLHHPDATVIIGTIGQDGTPHLAVRSGVRVLADGDLAFAEELDASQLSKDLIHALWFDRPLSVAVTLHDETWTIRALPWKCVVTGPLLQDFLLAERAARGSDADIATVWVLRVVAAEDDSASVRRAADLARRPNAGAHLDRASLRREA